MLLIIIIGESFVIDVLLWGLIEFGISKFLSLYVFDVWDFSYAEAIHQT